MRTDWGQSCVGIIDSQSYVNPKQAAECKSLMLSHLQNAGQLETMECFLKEESKAITLLHLVEDVLIPASRRPESDTSTNHGEAQDIRLVKALVKYLGMEDPKDNFEDMQDEFMYESIHSKVM